MPPSRVFGLTTDAANLAELRRARHKHLGGATGSYADPEFVERELAYAEMLFRSHPGWSVIEVTYKPIEEIASEILSIMRARNRDRKP